MYIIYLHIRGEDAVKVGIYHNANVEEEALRALVAALRRAGAEATCFSDAAGIGGVDRLVVLGGDGTVLHAAKRACAEGIPLVAVNFGTIGFLTEFGREELLDAVPLVLDRNCPTVTRSMLQVEVGGTSCLCLNEVSLQREISGRETAHVVTVSIRVDGSAAGEFSADGLIIATPTGSTAYSLSAGGCILTPDCKTFLMTPVCAFSLRSRPVALPDDSRLSVFSKDGTLLVYGDGVFLGRATPNEEIEIKKSEQCAVFLTRERNGFFRRLTEKIK